MSYAEGRKAGLNEAARIVEGRAAAIASRDQEIVKAASAELIEAAWAIRGALACPPEETPEPEESL